MTSTPDVDSAPRVLVVDDSQVVRHALYDLLAGAGYDVVLAHHGEEALRQLDVQPRVDVIVLDLEMPIMDGRCFLAAHRSSSHAGIPVILLSAFVSGEQARAMARWFGCRVLDKVEAGARLLAELDALTHGGSGRS